MNSSSIKHENTKPLRQVAIDDLARLRKAHPCGSFEWTVTRVGADIGLRCMGCERRVMLTREEFERRTRFLVSAVAEVDPWKIAGVTESEEAR